MSERGITRVSASSSICAATTLGYVLASLSTSTCRDAHTGDAILRGAPSRWRHLLPVAGGARVQRDGCEQPTPTGSVGGILLRSYRLPLGSQEAATIPDTNREGSRRVLAVNSFSSRPRRDRV